MSRHNDNIFRNSSSSSSNNNVFQYRGCCARKKKWAVVWILLALVQSAFFGFFPKSTIEIRELYHDNQQQQQNIQSNTTNDIHSLEAKNVTSFQGRLPSPPLLPSTQCWVDWDAQKKNSLMEVWLQHQVPLFVMAVLGRNEADLDDNNKYDDDPPTTNAPYAHAADDDSAIVYSIFTQAHLLAQSHPHQQLDYNNVEWKCLYHSKEGKEESGNEEDSDGGNDPTTATTIEINARFAPRHPQKGRNNLVLICNATTTTTTTSSENDANRRSTQQRHYLYAVQPAFIGDPLPIVAESLPTISSVGNNARPLDHPIDYYDVRHSLRCIRLEQEELVQSFITTEADTGNKISSSQLPQQLRIAACLRFKGDFDRSMLPQWIEYHRLLGIDHFFIYINEPWSMHGLLNNTSYITYQAFDQQWQDHPKYYQHYFRRSIPESGQVIMPARATLTQETEQTTCLYRAKAMIGRTFDWIMTTDVDEYLYLPKISNVPNNSNNTSTTTNHLPPLKTFLQRFDKEEYASLIVNSIPYGSNAFVNDTTTRSRNNTNNEYTIEKYVWRRDWNLTDYPFERYKQFYNVHKVWSLAVHYCYAVTSGTQSNVQLSPNESNHHIHLAHFKRAQLGVFKKGDKMMIKRPDELRLDTRLRDTYKADLMQRMQELLVAAD